MSEPKIFSSEELLPERWASFPAAGPTSLFNPAILKDGGAWIFAYRVVGPDGERRIGICRLDEKLSVVPGSARPFSDSVRFSEAAELPVRARSWFADPRLYRFGSRHFIYWNSGWHDPVNFQFLQEFDVATLEPIGEPRELSLQGERRPLEKNWMLFGEGPVYAVYSVQPHRILRVPLEGSGTILCSEVASTSWNLDSFVQHFGELRGGAPPQFVEGSYYSLCHSVHGVHGKYRYVPSAYRFLGEPPFCPLTGPAAPLALPNPTGAARAGEKLNPAVGEVVYPCGAVFSGGNWIVSYGINDERCAIATIPHELVLSSLTRARS